MVFFAETARPGILDLCRKKVGLNNVRRGRELEGGRRGRGPKCLYQISCRGLLGQNWGENPIFTPESPQKTPWNPPGQKWGGVGVCDSVAAICHTTRTPRVHPKKILFKPTPLLDLHPIALLFVRFMLLDALLPGGTIIGAVSYLNLCLWFTKKIANLVTNHKKNRQTRHKPSQITNFVCSHSSV